MAIPVCARLPFRTEHRMDGKWIRLCPCEDTNIFVRGHFLITPFGEGANLLLQIAMRIIRQVFRLRDRPTLPAFPQPSLARGSSGF